MNKSVCLYISNLLDALIESTTLSVIPKHATLPILIGGGPMAAMLRPSSLLQPSHHLLFTP